MISVSVNRQTTYTYYSIRLSLVYTRHVRIVCTAKMTSLRCGQLRTLSATRPHFTWRVNVIFFASLCVALLLKIHDIESILAEQVSILRGQNPNLISLLLNKLLFYSFLWTNTFYSTRTTNGTFGRVYFFSALSTPEYPPQLTAKWHSDLLPVSKRHPTFYETINKSHPTLFSFRKLFHSYTSL